MHDMTIIEYILNPYFLINVLWMLTIIYITKGKK